MARTASSTASASSDLIGRDDERRRQPEHVRPGREHEQAPRRGTRRRPARRAGRARRRAAARGHAPSVTPGSAASPASSCAPRARTFASSSSSIASTTAQAAAPRRGCRRRSSRGRRARTPRRRRSPHEQRADRQAVREPLGERDEVRRDRRAARRRRTCPCGRCPACTSSTTSSAPSSRASSAAACDERRARAGSRRPRRARARAGSPRCRRRREPRPRATRRRSGARRRRPGRAARTPPTSPGWPVAESAPSVRPWKPPSSATIRGPPGRLARELERRLVRLGARVAEERLRAAEPLGEERGEPQHRLRPVEVRRVPEPVELRVRGGEWRRVAVAEPDDGDAGDEVEVRAALRRPRRGSRRRATIVTSARAYVGSTDRARQRDVRSALCGREVTVTRRPPSRRSSARTPPRAATDGGHRASARSRPRSVPSPSIRSAVVDGDARRPRRRRRARRERRVTKRMRSAPRPTASAAAASSALTFSGPCGERRDDGDPAGGERVDDRGRRGGRRVADEPERLDLRAPAGRSRRRTASTAAAPIAAQTSALTAASDSRTTSSTSARRHAPPVDERRCDPAPLHLGGDLRAGAVHDDDVVPRRRAGRARAAAASAATRPPSLRTTRLTSCTPR